MYPIVSIIINYESTRAIVVMKRTYREYWINQYDLETYDVTF